MKDVAYVTNLHKFKSIRTHLIVLYVNGNNGKTFYDAIYFDSFEVKHIPKEIEKSIGNKNVMKNIYKIQAQNSIMCEYFCLGFIDFILKSKSVLIYMNGYDKNGKIILK